MDSKHIVILGGGFGGLAAARELASQKSITDKCKITVVDARGYHSYHADLYELATLPEELIDTQSLHASVSIPLKQTLDRFGVGFIQDSITAIHQKEKKVTLQNQTLEYDYLICALGSTSNYYGIPGAAAHSLSLKSTQDALRIRNALEFLFTRHKDDVTKQNISLVIVGGGFAGVELAAELAGFVRFMCWKYSYPTAKVHIKIVEAGSRLLAGLPDKVGDEAYRRLVDLKIEVSLASMITGVTDDLVVLSDGNQIRHDLLVWTAGVAACLIPFTTGFPQDRCGRLSVNNHLQLTEYPEVFVIGDGASAGSPLCDPPTATAALRQAAFLGRLFPNLIANQPLPLYQPQTSGFVITLGGKYAIYAGRVIIFGIVGYIIKWWQEFMYFRRLLGTFPAVRFIVRRARIYSRND